MTKHYHVKCGHEGCNNPEVNEWTIVGYEPEPVFFFCDEHAAEFGFCTSCGNFIGGTEDVFLTGKTGLCFDCFIAIERELEYANGGYGDDGEDDYYDD